MTSRGQYTAGDVVLGKLEIVRILGEGGMGVVYEVQHKITKHHRALKLLHPHISENVEVTVRLLREASVAGRIRNKHVVETFDAGQLDDGAAYVLMEMLEGKSFAELLEDGKPVVGRSVSLVWEACEGLAAAHREGIVHRDLKPDNLFLARDLDGEEIVKVLDFGISKFGETQDFAGKLTTDGAVMGTPFYMSPEQSRGLPDIDGRTDVYALGVVLYEALSGDVPFKSDTFPALVVRIIEGDCQHLTEVAPHVDPALAAVVHKAMAKDAADRYTSVRELQEALRPFSDRELPERFGSDSDLALGGTMLSDPSELRLPETRVSLPTPVAATSTLDTEPAKSRGPLLALGLLLIAGAGGLAFAFGSGEAEPEPEPVVVDDPVAGEGMEVSMESSVVVAVDAAVEGVETNPMPTMTTTATTTTAMTTTAMTTAAGMTTMSTMSAMSMRPVGMENTGESMTEAGTLTMMGTTIQTDIDL